MHLDVVVAAALPVALAFRKLNSSTPMVIGTGPALVRNGLAESMDRPGKKTTGLDELPPGLTARRLKLLKEAAPQITRVALLSTTPGVGGHEIQVADAESIAPALGVSVRAYRVASLSELELALATMPREGINGLVNFQGALSLVNRDRVTAFAAKHRRFLVVTRRQGVWKVSWGQNTRLLAHVPDSECCATLRRRSG